MAAADGSLKEVRGLILVGYPLHPPGNGGGRAPASRREHLFDVRVPMLFLQGTKDKLADIEDMRDLCASLGDRADLVSFLDADHSFHVPKRSGQTDAGVLDDLADACDRWVRSRGDPSSPHESRDSA